MLNTFLMQPWAGLPLAALIIVAGALVWNRRPSGAATFSLTKFSGGVVTLTGIILLLGATFAVFKGHHNIDPPGALVDVGNYRIHVWCEGSGDGPTIVWLPGGYGQALWSYQNHVDMKDQTRSCLVDRRGLGWSDPGPAELSPESLADELMRALNGAGESGPFVLAGHSFGGFYSITIAALYPENVDGVVLLDPTAPGWMDYFAYGNCGSGNPPAAFMFASLYGLAWIEALNPLLQDHKMREELGQWWPAYIAQELRPRSFMAQARALHTPCKDLYSFARWPGQLVDIPLLLITQTPKSGAALQQALSPYEGFRRENYMRFLETLNDEVLALSSNAQSRYAPEGAGHDFPRTHRDFTRDHILSFLRGPVITEKTPDSER